MINDRKDLIYIAKMALLKSAQLRIRELEQNDDNDRFDIQEIMGVSAAGLDCIEDGHVDAFNTSQLARIA